METIYIYAENHCRGGQVVVADVETDGEGYPLDDAIFLWGMGDNRSLVMMARTDLARHPENAPSFTRKCALAVLAHFGLPAVESEQEDDEQ